MFRELLVLQAPSSPLDLCAPLAERGWRVERSFDAAALLDDTSGVRAPVGIVVFDLPDTHDLTRIARLAAGPVQWIAVVDREAIRHPDVARLVADAFVDYHTLPLDLDRLTVILGHVAGRIELRRSLRPERVDATSQYGMTGSSVAMREVYRDIAKVVRADVPVLITGESGTGKELVARAIHTHSVRRAKPFVALNCGALPPNLIQSELFGYEKGAFTGAQQRKVGSIEAASGGTIFLDEIGDLPLEAQANLLRFLQERTIVRIGSTSPVTVDARVIAATHVDLTNAVRQRRFREDLFYRLNVLGIQLPPLRERTGDITLLADEVFARFAAQKAPQVQGFSIAARAAMEGHTWPGNVRELINRVQKAMIMCEGSAITPRDLGLDERRRREPRTSLLHARQTSERDALLGALERNGHNVSAAARDLGISRVTLYRMLQRLEIARPAPRQLELPGRVARAALSPGNLSSDER